MNGLLAFFPIYLNGLLAILFVFVLPGVVFVQALNIVSFPQRWLVVFLSSLTASHLLVTLIAQLHLDPLQTLRAVTAALIVTLTVLIARKARTATPASGCIMRKTDAIWLASSLVVLCFTYFNVWKHGVPNIFQGGDVSVSWNLWSMIWAKGEFPTASYGYPQFVPTIWAVTYIFTGSSEQYFAFYIYIAFLLVPLILSTAVLARANWRNAAAFLVVFVWFVAEIREPWLRATLQVGFPDWIAAISGFCGTALFIVNAPNGSFDREKIVTAFASLCLMSIAATTKPLIGVFTIAILIAVCADAAKYLEPAQRNRLIACAIGLVAAFAAAYAAYYSHLGGRSMPNYPVSALSDRLSRAWGLLNSNFTVPFRVLLFAGLAVSPFLPRIRWLTLPLLLTFSIWANTASYDLRNLLGTLLIAGLIPLFALAKRFATTEAASNARHWRIPDNAAIAVIAAFCVVLTLPLALSDEKLNRRFADEQQIRGLGIELNGPVGQLLARGCTIFSADDYIFTVEAFQRYRQQLVFFHSTEPLTESLAAQLNERTGCMSVLYPPSRTHSSIMARIDALSVSRGYAKIAEHQGMELLVAN
jgi:hypothetical protein